MRRRFLRSAAMGAVLLMVSFLPQHADAAVITTGCGGGTSCTFLQLLTGGTIQAGDLVFSGFTNFTNQSSTNVIPNVSLITVTGLDDGGLDPGPGLRFTLNGQFSVAFGQSMDLMTTFSVGPASPNSNQIKDSSITLQSVLAEGANSASGVEQSLYEVQGGAQIYEHVVDVRPSENVNILMSSTTFPARDSVYNTMILRVYPGTTTSGTASLNMFEIRFSQEGLTSSVAEPGSLTLLGAGLLLAGALARRRMRVG